ncbi:MAG: recombinase family protein [Chitinophagales bacterium]
MKYFIYARKSSESEDRQKASIEDQVFEAQRISEEKNLEVSDVITESMSAKSPGRNGFNKMIERIEKGEAHGIICWKLDRLARNPVDGGKISWMLQNELIKEIQTIGRVYLPNDNVLMMQVEFGVANQYVNDLSVNVQRGMRRKAERGWFPLVNLPLGYLHAKQNSSDKNEIIPDLKKFSLVKKVWKKMAKGNSSIIQLRDYCKEIGLRSKNGNIPSRNSLYRMFKNEFYRGYFYWKNRDGEIIKYKGKHKRMVSDKDFFQVQEIIQGKRNPSRVSSYFYPYRGLISCGECGGHITAEHKLQAICTKCKHKFSIKKNTVCPLCKTDLSDMKNPSVIDKTYYHCTKNKGSCSQGSITIEAIEESLVNEIEKYYIHQDFSDWLTETLFVTFSKDQQKDEIKKLKKRKTELGNKIKGLVELRLNKELTQERYKEMSLEKENELSEVKEKISHLCKSNKNISREKLKSCINTILDFHIEFRNGQKKDRHSMVNKVASNLVLKDKKLIISMDKLFISIKNCQTTYYSQNRCFEPRSSIGNKHSHGKRSSLCTLLRAQLNNIRTLLNEKINRDGV